MDCRGSRQAATAGSRLRRVGLAGRPSDFDTVRHDHSRWSRLQKLTRALEPRGVDYVFDAIGGANIGPCIGALRRGGTLVGFGFMAASTQLSQLAMFANIFLGARLRGRHGKFYGITLLYRKDPKLLREDLPKIFSLLAEGKIDPLIKHTFPLLDARAALELLAGGSVDGKIVLAND